VVEFPAPKIEINGIPRFNQFASLASRRDRVVSTTRPTLAPHSTISAGSNAASLRRVGCFRKAPC
jgi:hypothetical protein